MSMKFDERKKCQSNETRVCADAPADAKFVFKPFSLFKDISDSTDKLIRTKSAPDFIHIARQHDFHHSDT